RPRKRRAWGTISHGRWRAAPGSDYSLWACERGRQPRVPALSFSRRNFPRRHSMQFGLSEQQQLIVGTVRRFIETELIPIEDEIEKSGRLDPAKAKAIFEQSKGL